MKKELSSTPAARRPAEHKVLLLDEGESTRRRHAEASALADAVLDSAALHLLDATR